MGIIELLVPSDLDGLYTAAPFPHRIGPIGQVNIFVGPNNSGKSRLLRSIMRELKRGGFVPDSLEQRKLVSDRISLWQESENLSKRNLHSENDLVLESRKLVNEVAVPNRHSKTDPIEKLLSRSVKRAGNSPAPLLNNRVIDYLRSCKDSIRGLSAKGNPNVDVSYIPTLRGFRSPKSDSKYFDTRTSEDYFASSAIPTFAGGQFYDILTNGLLGDYSQRRQIRDFEQFVSDRFFESQSVQLIPRRSDNVVHVKIGTEKEQAIHELGDGLQHILLILFAAFKLKAEFIADQPLALFVEEPELFLHPGFQTRLIECFFSKELDGVQLFATTHSNHLIDFIEERARTSIFQVSKTILSESNEDIPKFDVVAITPNDRSILASLGVSKSSVFLSNCVIMVEGKTDKMYLQRLLEVFWDSLGKKHMMFDLHVTLIPYGGSCITDFDFAGGSLNTSRIFGEFLCVADLDESEWKRERHSTLKSCLKENYVTLPVLEIENLLTVETINKILREYEGKNFQEDLPLDREECKHKSLGTLIEETFATCNRTSIRRSNNSHPYAADSGTLKYKPDFCDKAMMYLSSLGDFVEEAKEVAHRLDSFIALHNQRSIRRDNGD